MFGAGRLGLSALRALRIPRVAGRWLGGRGVIFMLHRMVEPDEIVLDPTQGTTPRYLARCIAQVRAAGFDIVAPDEIVNRLADPDPRNRFICFTFDDGYRDTARKALPIFREQNAPFAVYVTTSIPDRCLFYWWRALETVVLRAGTIPLADGRPLPAATLPQKRRAFRILCASARNGRMETVRALAAAHRVDANRLLDEETLDWDELRAIARDPLVTIGAHTVTHPQLRQLDAPAALAEMVGSKRRLEAELQQPVRHFAYPYGHAPACCVREFGLAREAGFLTAVTTRPCTLVERATRSPWALPRIALDRRSEDLDLLDFHLSGASGLWRMRQHHPLLRRDGPHAPPLGLAHAYEER